MPVISALKKLAEIVASEKTHACTTQQLELTEKGKEAKLKRLIIEGMGDTAVAIKLDNIGFANKVFRAGHAARKACDAVVFCQVENQGYILMLDLKSSIPDEECIPQLLSGDCFADYLLAVLERFEQIKVSEGWQRRYFIFHCGNNKRTTLPDFNEKPPNNNMANKVSIQLVNNGEAISLRKLLRKPL